MIRLPASAAFAASATSCCTASLSAAVSTGRSASMSMRSRNSRRLMRASRSSGRSGASCAALGEQLFGRSRIVVFDRRVRLQDERLRDATQAFLRARVRGILLQHRAVELERAVVAAGQMAGAHLLFGALHRLVERRAIALARLRELSAQFGERGIGRQDACDRVDARCGGREIVRCERAARLRRRARPRISAGPTARAHWMRRRRAASCTARPSRRRRARARRRARSSPDRASCVGFGIAAFGLGQRLRHRIDRGTAAEQLARGVERLSRGGEIVALELLAGAIEQLLADAFESGARDVVVRILRARGLEQLARAVRRAGEAAFVERALRARQRVVEFGARQERAQLVLIGPRGDAERDQLPTPRSRATARGCAARAAMCVRRARRAGCRRRPRRRSRRGDRDSARRVRDAHRATAVSRDGGVGVCVSGGGVRFAGVGVAA